MKKYKLIKEYPASPKLGFIVFERHCGMYHNIETGNMYGSQMIENQPEYWEEVKEVLQSDYQIISFSTDFWDGRLAILDEDGRYATSPGALGWSLKELLEVGNSVKNEAVKIHSVKRLSDGEVFTVGDSVKVYEYSYIKNITGIIINSNPLVKEGIWLRYDSGSSHLSHATKVKQPIFLTHDGKDIFVGDRIIWVNKDSLLHGVFTADYGSLFCSNQHAYFTSAIDAQDYIEKNKVLFTTEDGVGIKKGNMVHGVYRTTHTISNTVVGCNRGLHDTFEAIFSTRAAAENYLVQKSHSLSIEDFWEFVSWGGSTIAKSKRLKRLVKERLGIK